MNGEAVFKMFYETGDAIIMRAAESQVSGDCYQERRPGEFRVVGEVVDLIVRFRETDENQIRNYCVCFLTVISSAYSSDDIYCIDSLDNY